MNFENPSARLVLNDDGELLDGKFCHHCGQISNRDGMICEHCGNPFPIPTTALRLRLEALRQSEGKKKDHDEVQQNLSGLNFILLSPIIILILIIHDLRTLFLNS